MNKANKITNELFTESENQLEFRNEMQKMGFFQQTEWTNYGHKFLVFHNGDCTIVIEFHSNNHIDFYTKNSQRAKQKEIVDYIKHVATLQKEY